MSYDAICAPCLVPVSFPSFYQNDVKKSKVPFCVNHFRVNWTVLNWTSALFNTQKRGQYPGRKTMFLQFLVREILAKMCFSNIFSAFGLPFQVISIFATTMQLSILHTFSRDCRFNPKLSSCLALNFLSFLLQARFSFPTTGLGKTPQWVVRKKAPLGDLPHMKVCGQMPVITTSDVRFIGV